MVIKLESISLLKCITILYLPGDTSSPLGSASFGFGLAEVGYLKPFSSIRQYFLLKPLSAGHCNVRINSFCML